MHGRELVTGILNILKPDVVEHTLQVNVVTHWSGPLKTYIVQVKDQ